MLLVGRNGREGETCTLYLFSTAAQEVGTISFFLMAKQILYVLNLIIYEQNVI